MIILQRMIWQQNDPTIRDFDRAAAVRDLPPMVSPHLQKARKKRRSRLGQVRYWIPRCAAPTAICALLMVPLLHGGRRRMVLGVLVLCGALIPVSYNVFEIANAFVPEDPLPTPSHAYLDDYVHIDGIQFTSMDDVRNTTIAIYDKKSFEGDGRRLLGFANRHVRILPDELAKPLFEAQGLEYPSQNKVDTTE